MNINSFPSGVLSQINENTIGGFILITINNRGAPQIHYKYENIITEVALEKYLITWLQSRDSFRQCVSDENTFNQMRKDDKF